MVTTVIPFPIVKGKKEVKAIEESIIPKIYKKYQDICDINVIIKPVPHSDSDHMIKFEKGVIVSWGPSYPFLIIELEVLRNYITNV
mgnify:CR=1 FL=1